MTTPAKVYKFPTNMGIGENDKKDAQQVKPDGSFHSAEIIRIF
jgi:hypothetical protein